MFRFVAQLPELQMDTSPGAVFSNCDARRVIRLNDSPGLPSMTGSPVRIAQITKNCKDVGQESISDSSFEWKDGKCVAMYTSRNAEPLSGIEQDSSSINQVFSNTISSPTFYMIWKLTSTGVGSCYSIFGRLLLFTH